MKIAEMLLTIGIPSFCTVLVFWWQECSANKQRETEAKRQRDQAIAIVELDLKTLNTSISGITQTLSNITQELIGIRERLAKLEVQTKPD
ncbi:hypothetical protein JYQ62_16180 [Nostoc sp. UHCC 0702]|nr:hypothetical protein JYQ62_16180 [Nostoc sp. UHCC 0702]